MTRVAYSSVALMFVWASLAMGVTLHVDDDATSDPGPGDSGVSDPLEDGTLTHPFDGIQEAIDAAVSGMDEIEIAPGTYYEQIDFEGKTLRLYSTEGAAATVLDGDGTGPVVQCISGEGPDTILEGVTITGGHASYGGGMHNSNSSPTVIHCTFKDNVAEDSGGGMYNLGSNIVMEDCTFQANSAYNYAGAMYNDSSSNPTINQCRFIGNVTTTAGGGAIYSDRYGSLAVTQCIFASNSSHGSGGAINTNSPASLTMSHCIVSNNSAQSGGGMLAGGDLNMTDCTFTQNYAAGLGGGALLKRRKQHGNNRLHVQRKLDSP